MIKNEEDEDDTTREDEMSEEEDEDELFNDDDDDFIDDDDEKEEKKSNKRSKSRKGEATRNILLKTAEKLYRTRDECMKLNECALFKRLMKGCIIKVEDGDDDDDTYLGFVKDAEFEPNPKNHYMVDENKCYWTLMIDSSFCKDRNISLDSLSNSPITRKDIDKYRKDKNSSVSLVTENEAKDVLKQVKKAESDRKNGILNDDEDEIKHIIESMQSRKQDDDDDDDVINVKKDKKKEIVMEEEKKEVKPEVKSEPTPEVKMEEERKEEFVLTKEVEDKWKEMIALENDMYEHLEYKRENEEEVQQVCNDFFKTYKLPTNQTTIETKPVLNKIGYDLNEHLSTMSKREFNDF